MYRYIIATSCIGDCLKISISDYYWKIDGYFWVFHCFFLVDVPLRRSSDDVLSATSARRPGFAVGVCGRGGHWTVGGTTEEELRHGSLYRWVSQSFFHHLHIESRLKFSKQKRIISVKKKMKSLKKNASGVKFFLRHRKKANKERKKDVWTHKRKKKWKHMFMCWDVLFRELKRTVLVLIFHGLLYCPAVFGHFLYPAGNHPRGAIFPTVD